MKRIIILIGATIILLGVTGCMNNNHNDPEKKTDPLNVSDETIDEISKSLSELEESLSLTQSPADDRPEEFVEAETRMLEHLKTKYNAEFIALDIEGPGFMKKHYLMIAVKQGDDTQTDRFCVYYDPSAEEPFADGYFGILIREELEKRMKQEADRYFSDYKLFISLSATRYNNALGLSSTIEDAAALGESLYASIYLFTPGAIDSAADLSKKLASSGVDGYLYVYRLGAADYAPITRDTFAGTLTAITDQTVSVIEKSESIVEA